MRSALLSLTAFWPALLLPGCILQSEICGAGFVESGDRCVVPQAAQPPPGGETTVVSEGWRDLAFSTTPTVRVFDGSTVTGEQEGQPLAGADLDAVRVSGRELEAFGAKVLSELHASAGDVVPPDSHAVLGAPDWMSGSAGLLWIGGAGSVEIAFSLPRELESGDTITVLEAAEPGGEGDLYSVQLCAPPGSSEEDTCVFLGTGGPGPVTFELR